MTSQTLFEAIKAGDDATVISLLEENRALVYSLDPDGLSAILTAAYYQQATILTVLLAYHDGLNLYEAAAVGATDQVSLWLRKSPELINKPASDGFTPLGLASFFGHSATVNLLLESGADPNIPSANRMQVAPLHSAVAGQHLAIATALLEHGADVNLAQQDGFTPLHGAAQNGQRRMIELLLAYGADSAVRTAAGQTASQLALAADDTLSDLLG